MRIKRYLIAINQVSFLFSKENFSLKIIVSGVFKYFMARCEQFVALKHLICRTQRPAKGADRVFYLDDGLKNTPRLIAKTRLKMKDLKTLEAFFMI